MDSESMDRQLFRRISSAIVVFAVLCAVVFGLAIANYGSLNRALSRLRGHEALLTNPVCELGTLAPSTQPAAAKFEIVNLTSTPLLITGCKSSCTCATTTTALPATIAVGSSKIMDVAIALRDGVSSDGAFDYALNVVFYTNSSADPVLPAVIRYREQSQAKVAKLQ